MVNLLTKIVICYNDFVIRNFCKRRLMPTVARAGGQKRAATALLGIREMAHV